MSTITMGPEGILSKMLQGDGVTRRKLQRLYTACQPEQREEMAFELVAQNVWVRLKNKQEIPALRLLPDEEKEPGVLAISTWVICGTNWNRLFRKEEPLQAA